MPAPGAMRGITSNQTRSRMKNEPFTTSAESTVLAAGGAPAWAGGSHKCNGTTAVFARSPTVISAAAAQVAGPASMRAASSVISSVA